MSLVSTADTGISLGILEAILSYSIEAAEGIVNASYVDLEKGICSRIKTNVYKYIYTEIQNWEKQSRRVKQPVILILLNTSHRLRA